MPPAPVMVSQSARERPRRPGTTRAVSIGDVPIQKRRNLLAAQVQ